ncbi:GNAT family N-acetyltransferase [Pedobacter mucosus]|uniref:GNAT family N-acetyltransferase n=1 Tax=Pedobacter mucosus TaxID=2895286 RepID=UPI001EE473FE|nr:GNAT family N-acetyltransferase [Pedobacter mucosus]UKT64302.1 GNAT family N-acetyltransferase [Pedobacter mucosus]
MPLFFKHEILTIHGIRTDNNWYTVFKELLEKRSDVRVVNFTYGYFTIWQFLAFWERRRVIKEFHDFYYKNFDPDSPPSVVCHSFGTYIFYTSIRKYSSIKFKKVILCGSILARGVDWRTYFKRKQIEHLYNDYGGLDAIVGLSPAVIREFGVSGKYGFKNIPLELQERITQEKNYFGHSDYFYPLQMKKNWIPKLLSNPKQFKYDQYVLRPEIFDRIYLDNSHGNFHYSEARYHARVDDKGNYFAHYSKNGTNQTDAPISSFRFMTTADSREQADRMGFTATQNGGKLIPGRIDIDKVQIKTCSFELDTPIEPEAKVNISYVFKWRETMTINGGDTDHFIIRDTDNISVSLNFPFTLIGPRIFVVSNGDIVDEGTPKKILERDGTHSYNFDYLNKFNYDALIFYYDGTNYLKSVPNQKEIKGFKKDSGTITYHTCMERDIRQVYLLEAQIEHGNAASEETLYNRLAMFPDGFIIAKDKGKIIGYIELVIWNNIVFETFQEIHDFPLFYDPNGETLYVIFIGVSANYRNQGVGQRLLEIARDISSRFNTSKMQLVAKEGLEKYYEKFSFEQVRELPGFLSGSKYKSTLMEK